LSLRSNPGLKLANACGVIRIKLANACGVIRIQLANVCGVVRIQLANACGVVRIQLGPTPAAYFFQIQRTHYCVLKHFLDRLRPQLLKWICCAKSSG
jgi:hypothetical protein